METLIELKGFTEICGSEKDVLTLGGVSCADIDNFIANSSIPVTDVLTQDQKDFIEAEMKNWSDHSGPNSSSSGK
jgi:hypothetical protein